MNIILSNASDKPIYEQITQQIKNAIMKQELLPGSPLPSIRMLAKELKISVMTTKRAYSDLEKDGFIETVAGKGSFVSSQNQDFIREENLRLLESHLHRAVEFAKIAGLSKEQLHEYLDMLLEEEL